MLNKRIVRMCVVAICLTVIAAMGLVLPVLPQGRAGTTLSATKTATGFHTRTITYDWSLQKSVSPTSVTIPTSNTVTVTYTLTATRVVVSDVTVAGVSGSICVTNGGDVATIGLAILDTVEFKDGPGPFQPLISAPVATGGELAAGETRCVSYIIFFTPVPGAIYRNSVKVTILNHSGHLGVPFGPEPKADFFIPPPTIIEIDENATISDAQSCPTGFTCTPVSTGQGLPPYGPFAVSSLVGSPVGFPLSFGKQIHNVSAPCNTTPQLPNTATLTENDTGQQRQASAMVSIDTGPCQQGCTPGFWKNHTGAWVGLSPGASVGSVFPNAAIHSLAGFTLLNALSFRGGSTLAGAAEILLRAGVAAALNEAHPSVSYPFAGVVALVNGALNSGSRSTMLNLAGQLDAANNLGCPLGS